MKPTAPALAAWPVELATERCSPDEAEQPVPEHSDCSTAAVVAEPVAADIGTAEQLVVVLPELVGNSAGTAVEQPAYEWRPEAADTRVVPPDTEAVPEPAAEVRSTVVSVAGTAALDTGRPVDSGSRKVPVVFGIAERVVARFAAELPGSASESEESKSFRLSTTSIRH